MGLLAIDVDVVFTSVPTVVAAVAVVVLSEGTAAITGKGGL